MNEFEAAMGLCVRGDMEMIVEQRKEIYELYAKSLKETGLVSVLFWVMMKNNKYQLSLTPLVGPLWLCFGCQDLEKNQVG